MGHDHKFEIVRIRAEYEKREKNSAVCGWKKDVYHLRHSMGRLFYEHHLNITIDALNSVGFELENASVLDFGCGSGGWLRMLRELGASPGNLTGMDMSESRIRSAKSANPAINYLKSEGDCIPFPAGTFDMVMQVVVFSSVLDEGLANALAAEMVRVTKPGGMVFWLDHKASFSENLSGYSLDRLSWMFPSCVMEYKMPVQPRYFRYRYGHPMLCRLAYRLTKLKCDSWLVVFRKEGERHASQCGCADL